MCFQEEVSKTCAQCAGVCFDCLGTQVFKSLGCENDKSQESNLLFLFLRIARKIPEARFKDWSKIR